MPHEKLLCKWYLPNIYLLVLFEDCFGQAIYPIDNEKDYGEEIHSPIIV